MKIILAFLLSSGLLAQGRLPRFTAIPDPITGAPGEMLFREDAASGTDYVRLRGPAALAGPITLTLPIALPAADAFLVGSSTGQLSWSNLSGYVDTCCTQTIEGAKSFRAVSTWINAAGDTRAQISGTGSVGTMRVFGTTVRAAMDQNGLTSYTPGGIRLINDDGVNVDTLWHTLWEGSPSNFLTQYLYNRDSLGVLRERVRLRAGAGQGSVWVSGVWVDGATIRDTPISGLVGGAVIGQIMQFSDRVDAPTRTRIWKLPSSGDALHSFIWPALDGVSGDCLKRGAGTTGTDVPTLWGSCGGGGTGNFVTLDTDQTTSPDWITGDKVISNAAFTFRSTGFFSNNLLVGGTGIEVQSGTGAPLITLGALGTAPLETWKDSGGVTRWDRDADRLLGYSSGGVNNLYISGTRITVGSSISATGIPGNRGVTLSSSTLPLVIYNNSGQPVWNFGYAGTVGYVETRDSSGVMQFGVTGVCGTVTVHNGIVTGCSP